MSTSIKRTCHKRVALSANIWPPSSYPDLKKIVVGNLRLIIHPCISGILTIGLGPQAAIAGTASCIAASGRRRLSR